MEIPKPGAVPNLGEIGNNLPDAIHLDFVLVQHDFFIETSQAGRNQARLVFYVPMLPFIKFSIAFDAESLDGFASGAAKALAILERAKDVTIEAVDGSLPPAA